MLSSRVIKYMTYSYYPIKLSWEPSKPWKSLYFESTSLYLYTKLDTMTTMYTGNTTLYLYSTMTTMYMGVANDIDSHVKQ